MRRGADALPEAAADASIALGPNQMHLSEDVLAESAAARVLEEDDRATHAAMVAAREQE